MKILIFIISILIIFNFNLSAKDDIFNPDYEGSVEIGKLKIIELKLLKNRIFAKHGMDFDSVWLKNYFSKYASYKNHYKKNVQLTGPEEKMVKLIDEEIKNKEKIIKYKYETFLNSQKEKEVKYYKKRLIKEELSKKLKEKITKTLSERFGESPDLFYLDMVSMKFQNEINPKWIQKKLKRDPEKEEMNLEYFEVSYVNSKPFSLDICYLDVPPGIDFCNPKIYFSISEKVHLIRYSLAQTSIMYYWWFHYLDEKLVLLEYTEFASISDSEGIGEVFRKSFWIE